MSGRHQELISDSRQDPGAASFSTGQRCSNQSHQTTVIQSGGRQSLINGPHDHMTQLSVGPPLSSSSSFLFPPLSLSLSLSHCTPELTHRITNSTNQSEHINYKCHIERYEYLYINVNYIYINRHDSFGLFCADFPRSALFIYILVDIFT